MATPINAAATAYANTAKLLGQAGKPALDQSAGLGGSSMDFAKLLGEQLQGVLDQGKVADTQAMNLVSGRGDMVDVVTAISQTEIAMETMVTVRDRVISAYEEIMRMPI